MSMLSKILLTQMALSQDAPYRSTINLGTTKTKPPKNKGKPISRVIYYTDENGKIRRAKMELGEKK